MVSSSPGQPVASSYGPALANLWTATGHIFKALVLLRTASGVQHWTLSGDHIFSSDQICPGPVPDRDWTVTGQNLWTHWTPVPVQGCARTGPLLGLVRLRGDTALKALKFKT